MGSQIVKLRFVPVLLLGICSGLDIRASDFFSPILGSLAGSIADSGGRPQLGASVELYDRYNHLVRRASSTMEGRFAFADLPADRYSLHVVQESFLPASRNGIDVRPGISSVLTIHLATLFSSIELAYQVSVAGMSEDWKWVLRTSSATRPITRFLPGTSSSDDRPADDEWFQNTRGMIAVGGGDSSAFASDAGIGDFGTQFAVSTKFRHNNQIQAYGAVGDTLLTGMPTFGVRAVYSRASEAPDGPDIPEIALSVRQLSIPARATLIGNSGPNGTLDSSLSLRTVSLDFYDQMDVGPNLHLEYGASLESINYVDRVSRATPFARATYRLGQSGLVRAAFSNGADPTALYLHSGDLDSEMARSLAAVQSLPPLSVRNGRLQVQRTRNYEVGWTKEAGSRTYAVSAFFEEVSDGRLNLSGDTSSLEQASLLGDLSTKTTIYNVGSYSRSGFVASFKQVVNDHLNFGFAFGQIGGFTAPNDDSPSSLSSRWLNSRLRNVASTHVRTRLPRLGTRLNASYEWIANGAVVPQHTFTTQQLALHPGVNIAVRQPLPPMWGLPGRLELCGDVRNMLAQGYMPLGGSASRLLLIQAPRTIRGGLSFNF